MTLVKLVIFSLLPAAALFLLIEGATQLYWLYREVRATNTVAANGEKKLKNDAINFLKEPDGVLGYRLRANLKTSIVSNSRGLAQAEEIPYRRTTQSLRIMCIGESTTMGHSTTGNYPTQLRMLLSSVTGPVYPGGTEVINGGVAGWISDQWALYSDRELYKYQPDVVVFYAGWNDFQVYYPLAPPPRESVFRKRYGGPPPVVHGLKSVVLARAWIDRTVTRWMRRRETKLTSVIWQRSDGAQLESGTGKESVRAYLPLGSHISAMVFPTDLRQKASGDFEVTVQLRGEGNSVLGIRSYAEQRTAPLASCSFTPRHSWSPITCTFTSPPGAHGFEIFVAADNGATTLDLKSLLLNRMSAESTKQPVAAWAANSPHPPAKATYPFFMENLERSVNAFRSANPNVKVVISSLVGRWPMDTEEQFRDRDGHVWWMKVRGIGRYQAADLLNDLNAVIEGYAKDNGFLFVDMARAFKHLDRQKLMWDFQHLSEEGYRIMALLFYRSMREAGLLEGPKLRELDKLLMKYRATPLYEPTGRPCLPRRCAPRNNTFSLANTCPEVMLRTFSVSKCSFAG
ncbi:MAG: SGNH/GDSL hydrolase family protein [Gammaproteobacteria bacterium]|nr:SGNH/GDSL hydrolase family protein [Gammaproteobacteria bacterium]MDH3411902.1 SGNH/GDSL hydrolase family protein [Gammaproteobacteria bacterium]